MKIYILGSTGLLGSYMSRRLKQTHHRVLPLNRNHFDASVRKLPRDIVDSLDPGDVVINCTGVLKPKMRDIAPEKTIMINSYFPMMIGEVCREKNANFIHFCSDCVFTGEKDDGYIETDLCDATDLYAKTKSLTPNYGTILRVSFVGEESSPYSIGLLSKMRQMSMGSSMEGYTNCLWNGMTALQVAKVVDNIITDNNYWHGVRHVFSPDTISKFDLCNMINETYGLRLNIKPRAVDQISGSSVPVGSGFLDRSLDTIHDKIKIPSLMQQLLELRSYDSKHS